MDKPTPDAKGKGKGWAVSTPCRIGSTHHVQCTDIARETQSQPAMTCKLSMMSMDVSTSSPLTLSVEIKANILLYITKMVQQIKSYVAGVLPCLSDISQMAHITSPGEGQRHRQAQQEHIDNLVQQAPCMGHHTWHWLQVEGHGHTQWPGDGASHIVHVDAKHMLTVLLQLKKALKQILILMSNNLKGMPKEMLHKGQQLYQIMVQHKWPYWTAISIITIHTLHSYTPSPYCTDPSIPGQMCRQWPHNWWTFALLRPCHSHSCHVCHVCLLLLSCVLGCIEGTI